MRPGSPGTVDLPDPNPDADWVSNRRGAAWMAAGMLGYVINDALIKWTAEEVPLFQAIFLRGLIIVTLLSTLVNRLDATISPRTYLKPALVIRMAMEAISTVLYLLALTNIPLANLTAIMQLVPLAVTFAAARLLRERVNPLRLAAVAAGFGGVVLIIRPGTADFSPWYLAGLATVIVVVVRELATRHVPPEIPGVAVALGTGVVITVISAIISSFQGWESGPPVRFGALAVAACFLSLGYLGSINSVRAGELSFTAPFRYTVLVWAIALQILVFSDVPDTMTFVGAGIVASAGLVALRAEVSKRRA